MTMRAIIREIVVLHFPYLHEIWARLNWFLGRDVTPIYVPPFSG